MQDAIAVLHVAEHPDCLYLHATRAELLRRLDRVDEARAATTERSSWFTRTPGAAS